MNKLTEYILILYYPEDTTDKKLVKWKPIYCGSNFLIKSKELKELENNVFETTEYIIRCEKKHKPPIYFITSIERK